MQVGVRQTRVRENTTAILPPAKCWQQAQAAARLRTTSKPSSCTAEPGRTMGSKCPVVVSVMGCAFETLQMPGCARIYHILEVCSSCQLFVPSRTCQCKICTLDSNPIARQRHAKEERCCAYTMHELCLVAFDFSPQTESMRRRYPQ